MKRFKKILLTTIVLCGLTWLWFWADNKDYFQADYNNLTTEQEKLFTWQDGDDEEKLTERYRQHFADNEFQFPRRKVSKVKLFKNIPIFSIVTSMTLKQNFTDSFLHFCNDTTNFYWRETSWATSESEYYCKLYNDENKVVGKIYFCLKDCGMTSSQPFCPSMKFGALSETGLKFISKFLDDNSKWE